jgi:hypothetical protein
MPLIRPKKPYSEPASGKRDTPTLAGSLSAESIEGIPLLTQQMGKAIANAHLYGTDHSIAQATLDQAFATLSRQLDEKNQISMHVAEGQLFADGEALEIKNPLMGTFAQAVATLGVNGITLEKGLSREEFGEFAKALIKGKMRAPQKQDDSAPDSDSGHEPPLLDASRFSHLKAQKTVYRAVAEDEVVVQRDVAAQAESLSGFDGGQVRQIVAFLKGGAGSLPAAEQPLQDLDAAATNAGQLADLIMKSAVVDSRQAEVEGGETLGNIVVGCLRRTFDSLNRAPGAQTRKGKRAIKKTLTILEKDILDRLKETARQGHALAESEVSEAVSDMTEELQASDLIEQYARKSRAVNDDEARLARFIRKKGVTALQDSALKDKLIEEGLSEDDWRKIVIRSGLAEPPPDHTDAPAGRNFGATTVADPAVRDGTQDDTQEVSSLIALLTDLTEAVAHVPAGGSAAPAENSGLMKVLAKIGSEVDAALAQTDEKVEALAQLAEMLAGETTVAEPPLREDESDLLPQKKQGARSRAMTASQQRSVIRILGEITQEFSQPLSVVACTLDMLAKMDAPALEVSAPPLLELARESVKSMEDLIAKVVHVTGLPKGMSPDRALLDALNDMPIAP